MGKPLYKAASLFRPLRQTPRDVNMNNSGFLMAEKRIEGGESYRDL